MEKTRRRLGRGLEALLGPTTVGDALADGSLTSVSLAAIQPNPYQPRHVFDEKALDELKTSLKQSGLLQPVIVRPGDDGKFELIAGERRCRAAQLLGWTEISASSRYLDCTRLKKSASSNSNRSLRPRSLRRRSVTSSEASRNNVRSGIRAP